MNLKNKTVLSAKKTTKTRNVSKTEIYLDYVVNNIPHFVFWKDVNSVFLGCNKQFSDSIKFDSPEEIIGKTDYEMPWKKEESDAYIADDKKIMESGVPKLDYEELQRQADDSERIMLVSKVPMYDDDHKIIGVLGIYTDITERKKMEEELRRSKEAAEAASKAKTMFLANMSHDIKTPITGIISTAEYLVHTTESSDFKGRADDIVQSSSRLLELMNEIIEVSRLEVKENDLTKIRFNPKKLIDDIVQLIKPAIVEKEFKLALTYDNKIPNYLVGDRWHLYRVILNLLSNAIKFTQDGSIKINLKLIKKLDNEAILKFSISDTGIGIPKDKQAVIFDEFTRLTPSYEGRYDGTGLGLYIVKRFVKAMRGKIRLESEEGKGSTFTCEIPFKIPSPQDHDTEDTKIIREEEWPISKKLLASDLKMKEKIKSEQKIPTAITAINILLVEDNEIAARAARACIEQVGGAVVHAANGKNAIDSFKKNKFDLIFMDLGLPDMNGTEATMQIREIECLTGVNDLVPIVGLSAHIDKEIEKNCIDAGMTDALTKPLLMEQAKAIINKALEIKQKRSQKKFIGKTGKVEEKNNEELKVIDLEAGAAILGTSNLREAKKMLGMLIDTLPKCKAEMDQLYKNKDYKQLEKVAHHVHSGVAYVGAPKLRKALRTIVDEIRANRLEDIDTLYKRVCDGINELITVYKNL